MNAADEDRAMHEHIADATLTLACADMVRNALRNADHLALSLTEERMAVARGTRLMLDSGVYLRGNMLFLPSRSIQ